MRYTAAQRDLQDRFDTRRIADRIDQVLVRDTVDDGARSFIKSRDMFFLASVDADGQPTCSYKGGDPGFVRVLDPRTLAFPSYDGNGMFLSLGNVVATARVGLLFLDFTSPQRLRVHGTASVSSDDPLVGSWPGAQLVVRVRVTAVFPNCPRYIHRMQPVTRSPYVPRAGAVPPVPDWKRSDWAHDALPASDPAREGDGSR
jgi:predicted pyridoxine 5'-phosphate oxidase superfamily flavin-nucleotide-binding protein